MFRLSVLQLFRRCVFMWIPLWFAFLLRVVSSASLCNFRRSVSEPEHLALAGTRRSEDSNSISFSGRIRGSTSRIQNSSRSTDTKIQAEGVSTTSEPRRSNRNPSQSQSTSSITISSLRDSGTASSSSSWQVPSVPSVPNGHNDEFFSARVRSKGRSSGSRSSSSSSSSASETGLRNGRNRFPPGRVAGGSDLSDGVGDDFDFNGRNTNDRRTSRSQSQSQLGSPGDNSLTHGRSGSSRTLWMRSQTQTLSNLLRRRSWPLMSSNREHQLVNGPNLREDSNDIDNNNNSVSEIQILSDSSNNGKCSGQDQEKKKRKQKKRHCIRTKIGIDTKNQVDLWFQMNKAKRSLVTEQIVNLDDWLGSVNAVSDLLEILRFGSSATSGICSAGEKKHQTEKENTVEVGGNGKGLGGGSGEQNNRNGGKTRNGSKEIGGNKNWRVGGVNGVRQYLLYLVESIALLGLGRLEVEVESVLITLSKEGGDQEDLSSRNDRFLKGLLSEMKIVHRSICGGKKIGSAERSDEAGRGKNRKENGKEPHNDPVVDRHENEKLRRLLAPGAPLPVGTDLKFIRSVVLWELLSYRMTFILDSSSHHWQLALRITGHFSRFIGNEKIWHIFHQLLEDERMGRRGVGASSSTSEDSTSSEENVGVSLSTNSNCGKVEFARANLERKLVELIQKIEKLLSTGVSCPCNSGERAERLDRRGVPIVSTMPAVPSHVDQQNQDHDEKFGVSSSVDQRIDGAGAAARTDKVAWAADREEGEISDNASQTEDLLYIRNHRKIGGFPRNDGWCCCQ